MSVLAQSKNEGFIGLWPSEMEEREAEAVYIKTEA